MDLALIGLIVSLINMTMLIFFTGPILVSILNKLVRQGRQIRDIRRTVEQTKDLWSIDTADGYTNASANIIPINREKGPGPKDAR